MDKDIFCENNGGNTGLSLCGILPGRISSVFFVREKTTLSPVELADLEATIKEKVALENLNQRFYPIHGVDEWEDSSEDATITTSGGGYSEKTAPGSVQYSLQYHLDLCRTKQLSRWDGFRGYCFFADDNGNFWGKRDSDGTLSALKLSNVIANLRMAKTGADITYDIMVLNFGAPTKIFWDTLDAEKYSFDMTEIVGILDLALRRVAATTFTAELTCGGGSVYNQYKTAIAKASAWSAVNAVTGAAITISAVAENDALSGYAITFDTPPAAGTKVTVSLDMSALSGISGYEARPITYTA